jgi:SPP1 gp7 family putative phage head morphogenesis protein
MADEQNISDQLADNITTHSISVLRVAAGLRQDVLAMLKRLQGRLVGDLEEHGPNPRLAALLRQTTDSIDSAYGDIVHAHTSNLEDIATAETEQAANLVNHAIGVETMTTGQSQHLIETIAGKTLLEGHYPAQWWEGQAEDLKTRFKGAMQQGMLAGESVDDLVKRVRGTAALGYTDGIMQASRAQAEALVRTSVQSVANESRLNTYRGNDDVVKGIQWLSTLDSRTTAICRALDGLQWDLDYRPIGHNKAFPGPIAHWNCFTGDVPVQSPSGACQLYRRPYSGELITIETDHGRRVTLTPNHPLLTPTGWEAAGKLYVGERLICQKGTGGNAARNPENQSSETTFAKLTKATAELHGVLSAKMPITRPDFHGDGSDGEVGEIWTYGALSDKGNAALAKMIGKLPFHCPYLDRPDHLTSFCGTFKSLARYGLATLRRIGRFSRWLFPSIPSSAQILRSGSSDTGTHAPSAKARDGYPKFPSDFSGRELIGNVEMDRIVVIRRTEAVSVFVHNLETPVGWYLADGIASHNCRSTQIPITKSWAELSGKKVGVDDATLDKALQDKAKAAGMPAHEADKLIARTRASMDGQVAAKTTFGDWVGSKSHAEQDAILGTAQAQLHRAGKITMGQLTDQNNRPLTVAQLQALATQKQLIPARQYVTNQGGLTMHQRNVAEDQLSTLAATGNETTTFLNDDTGHTVSFQNGLPTADHEDKITAIDASTVVKTALTDDSLLTANEARTYEKLGIDELRIVRLDGSTLNISGAFTPTATDILVAKLAIASSSKPERRTIEALKAAGFQVTRTRQSNVQIQIAKPLQ